MEQDSQPQPPWSLPIRIVVLSCLMIYLSIVVLAPLTNPIGARELTTPVANAVSPVHQALYLNHGYRFFGPDPGPSHSLVYEIETAAGDSIKGHFPDRENTSPRLMYHRWFMLSESMYREFSVLSMKPEIDKLLVKFDGEIAELARQGQVEQSKAMAAERDQAVALLDAERVSFDKMMLGLGRNLVSRFGSQGGELKSIRMWIRRRIPPTAEQSLAGVELTDESLITQAQVGFFTAEQLAAPDAVEAAADLESIAPAGDGDE